MPEAINAISILAQSRQSQMRGTAYSQHMLHVNKLPIDVFYDLYDLEVIIDTYHGISFVELPMDVSYSLDDLEVIVDT